MIICRGLLLEHREGSASHVLGTRRSDTIVQTPYGVFSSSNRSEMSSALTSTLHNHAQLSGVTRGKKKNKKGLCFMKP